APRPGAPRSCALEPGTRGVRPVRAGVLERRSVSRFRSTRPPASKAARRRRTFPLADALRSRARRLAALPHAAPAERAPVSSSLARAGLNASIPNAIENSGQAATAAKFE